MWSLRRLCSPRFVPPPAVPGNPGAYCPGFSTYSDYNYLKSNRVARWIKQQHFESALELSAPWCRRGRVMDFGCADGPFLPTLSRYFRHATAVDFNPEYLRVAGRVAADLPNVQLVCNEGMTPAELAAHVPHPFDVIFSLETLEHVGEPGRVYEPKVELLRGLSPLLAPGGVFVVSVPVMVGPAFLAQRVGLWLLGMQREPISRRDLYRAVVWSDTEALEPGWTWQKHLGFNHVKMMKYLSREFEVVGHRHDVFQVAYKLHPRTPTKPTTP